MFIDHDGSQVEIRFTPRSYKYLGGIMGLGSDPKMSAVINEIIPLSIDMQFDKAAYLVYAGLMHDERIKMEWVRENITENIGIAKKIINEVIEELIINFYMWSGMSRREAEKTLKSAKSMRVDQIIETIKDSIDDKKKRKKKESD